MGRCRPVEIGMEVCFAETISSAELPRLMGAGGLFMVASRYPNTRSGCLVGLVGLAPRRLVPTCRNGAASSGLPGSVNDRRGVGLSAAGEMQRACQPSA